MDGCTVEEPRVVRHSHSPQPLCLFFPYQVNPKISVGHALVVELLITFQLVFTIFATCDPKRNDLGGSASLSIGLAVVIGHLFAVSIPSETRYSGPAARHE